MGFFHAFESYYPATPIQLQKMFKKDITSIRMAIQRMKDHNDGLYVRKGKKSKPILVEASGVKWITENYYRKSYLKKLEQYKLDLQILKRKKIEKKKIK